MSSELFELHIVVAETTSELFEEAVREIVGAGFERRDQETLNPPASGEVELVAWMPDEVATRCVERVVALGKSLLEQGTLQSEPRLHKDKVKVDAQDWLKAYREHFKTTQIGRLVTIRPSWEPRVPGSEEMISIEIDPGLAFGTGLHPSTHLAIKALERLYDQGRDPHSTVDVGCGSGILSIVAAKLWPDGRILALDNDPVAVQVCRENMARNHAGPRVFAEEREASKLQGKFDLLLANLSFEVLENADEWIARCLSMSGRAILSGLLAEQASQVCKHYARDLKFEVEYTEELDGWRCALLRLRG